MVLLELMISSIKLAVMFALLLLFCAYLVFKIMAGISGFFYERGSNFYAPYYAYKDTELVSNKFKPVLGDLKIIPLLDAVELSAGVGKRTKFKVKLMRGPLRHEILSE